MGALEAAKSCSLTAPHFDSDTKGINLGPPNFGRVPIIVNIGNAHVADVSIAGLEFEMVARIAVGCLG